MDEDERVDLLVIGVSNPYLYYIERLSMLNDQKDQFYSIYIVYMIKFSL